MFSLYVQYNTAWQQQMYEMDIIKTWIVDLTSNQIAGAYCRKDKLQQERLRYQFLFW